MLIKIYEKYLPKYDPDILLSVKESNIYYCNYKMFDEDGNIIKSKKELDGRSNKKTKKSLKKKRKTSKK